jgi:hypothetical protein
MEINPKKTTRLIFIFFSGLNVYVHFQENLNSASYGGVRNLNKKGVW